MLHTFAFMFEYRGLECSAQLGPPLYLYCNILSCASIKR